MEYASWQMQYSTVGGEKIQTKPLRITMNLTIRLENEDSSRYYHFFLKLNANLVGVPVPSDMLII